MLNKKHYWTQVFLVTTVVSCGLGLASGFGGATFIGSNSASMQTQNDELATYSLEVALQQCSQQSYVPLLPCPQPGAIELEPYYANRSSSPPYMHGELPEGVPVLHNSVLRMEGIPSSDSRPFVQRKGPCHGILDFTKIAVLLSELALIPLLFAGVRYHRRRQH